MKKYSFGIFFLFFCLGIKSQDNKFNYIDSNIINTIKERVDGNYVPSIIVGIIDSTKQMDFFSYGSKSFDSKCPVDENTIYEIGSDTKTFTTTLLSILIERGYLKLDNLLVDFLPDSIKGHLIGYENITIKALATHTSGLPRIPSNLIDYSDYKLADLFFFLKNNPYQIDTTKTVVYSNLGVGLLGYIMETRMKKSYEELVKEYICKEFNLQSTTITLTNEMRNRLASPYSGKTKVNNIEFGLLHGCGALRSTAHDLLLYLSYYLGLEDTRYRDAIEKTSIDYYKRDEVSNQCLAWIHHIRYNKDFYGHGGRTKGYNSFVGFSKSLKIGVVVLCNSHYSIGDIGFYVLSNHESQLISIDKFLN